MKISSVHNSFITFAAIFLLLFSNCSTQTTKSTNKNEPEDLPLVEYCELRNNPDQYDGKTVRLKAEIRSGQHGDRLYDERCPGDEGIYSYPDGLAAVFYKNKADQDKVKEIRDKRIKNGSNQKLWTDPINVTVIGLFRKNKPVEHESGYDKNAPFHFLIITIESFSATSQ